MYVRVTSCCKTSIAEPSNKSANHYSDYHIHSATLSFARRSVHYHNSQHISLAHVKHFIEKECVTSLVKLDHHGALATSTSDKYGC